MKTKNKTVKKSQMIDATWGEDCCDETNPVYENYLNWIKAWNEGTHYEEPPEFLASVNKNRPEGFRTKSIVIRIMFDYLLLTYTRNNSIDITDVLDDVLRDFFKKASKSDLKPLSEKSFMSTTKKYSNLQKMAKKTKK